MPITHSSSKSAPLSTVQTCQLVPIYKQSQINTHNFSVKWFPSRHNAYCWIVYKITVLTFLLVPLYTQVRKASMTSHLNKNPRRLKILMVESCVRKLYWLPGQFHSMRKQINIDDFSGKWESPPSQNAYYWIMYKHFCKLQAGFDKWDLGELVVKLTAHVLKMLLNFIATNKSLSIDSISLFIDSTSLKYNQFSKLHAEFNNTRPERSYRETDCTYTPNTSNLHRGCWIVYTLNSQNYKKNLINRDHKGQENFESSWPKVPSTKFLASFVRVFESGQLDWISSRVEL